jgi:hypothetical protein
MDKTLIDVDQSKECTIALMELRHGLRNSTIDVDQSKE